MSLADKPIRAAGGVLWRPAGAGVELAVIHRPRYDDWSLPKGKLEPGEHPLDAAVREVREETGYTAVVGRRLPGTSYHGLAGPKTVDYWAMRLPDPDAEPVTEDAAVPEVDRVSWLPVEATLDRLTYDHDAEVVRDFGRVTADSAVLLVRHARAGDRDAWPGPDDLRPLDVPGLRQAARLADVLPLFGPCRVLSADRVRCVQTVQPLASRLGVEVVLEPGLSEEGYAAAPARGLRRIRDLGAAGEVSVVCGQGGAIPDIVATIAGEDGVRLPHFRSRKGSVWALSFRDGLLVAADYYRDFEP
jgi:8-oxo-dGTP pyrophosphatase MutT (NUDIX family)